MKAELEWKTPVPGMYRAFYAGKRYYQIDRITKGKYRLSDVVNKTIVGTYTTLRSAKAVTTRRWNKQNYFYTTKGKGTKTMTVAAFTKLPQIAHHAINLGCDPEFFFKTGDTVIGAEHVLPKDGLNVSSGDGSKFIIDGVQAELNPAPNTCRANLANEIKRCFVQLKKDLDAKGTKVTLDFSRSLEISKEELAKLDANNQKLGCMPSKSVYPTTLKLSEIDGTQHRQRSAGGHIHIGNEYNHVKQRINWNANEIVTMLDIVVGNTCVLLDRDPGNAIRRKLYGRAGEYRLPKHGLEYRTLSNFWLEAYPLMSFTFGMVRTAVNMVCDQTFGKQFYEAFTGVVDQEKVAKAINENDFDLAYENFKAIEPILSHVTPHNESYVLSKQNMPKLHYVVNTIKEKGLKHFFPKDPLTHWTTLPEAHVGGAFDWLRNLDTPALTKAAV